MDSIACMTTIGMNAGIDAAWHRGNESVQSVLWDSSPLPFQGCFQLIKRLRMSGHAVNSSPKHVPGLFRGSGWPVQTSDVVVQFVPDDMCSVTWRIIIHEKVTTPKSPHLRDHVRPNDLS